jgi:hypothetical protein
MEINEINKRIKVGEWFCAEQGIGIAERIHHFYFEEYDHIPQNKVIGDYNYSMVEYKLFCDYNGNPIKRNRFKALTSIGCDPIEKKYKKVLDRCIINFPKEYASFIKFLDVPKQTKSWKLLEFEISEENKCKAVQDIDKIQKMLPSKFTYKDVLKIAADNQCIIDFSNHLSDTWFVPLYLRIILGYTYGDFAGKRILFHRFDYQLCESWWNKSH